MGGRKDYPLQNIVGSNRLEIRQDINNLELNLNQQDTSKAIEQLLTLAIHSEQTLQTISVSIKLIKLAYEIYILTEENIQAGDDFDTALTKAIFSVVEQKLVDKKQIIIEEAVKLCWNEVKEKRDINSRTNEVDEIVINSVTQVLLECMG